MTNAAELANSPARESDPPADPFSSDLFGADENLGVPKPDERLPEPMLGIVEPDRADTSSWAAGLPKIPHRFLESSGAVGALPGRFSDAALRAIEGALGEVVFPGTGAPRCSLVSMAECDLFAEAAVSARTANLAVQIVFEPTGSFAVVLVSEGSVHQIIDRIFGPARREYSQRLSPIETAIAEFLAARVVARINDDLGSEYFSVGETSLTAERYFSEHEAGAKAGIEVQADGSSRMLRVLISSGFLSSLKAAGRLFDQGDNRRAANLFAAVRSIPLRAQIGSTHLDARTISFLEPGDVVIVEDSKLDLFNGPPRGEVRILAGAGNNFVLTGDLIAGKNAGPASLRVLLKDILSREAVSGRNSSKFIMEVKNAEAEWDAGSVANEDTEIPEDTEISAPLENLRLRLRIELAGKTISLREINGLRAGQVIDLERGPADSVDLVTDGSDEKIAVGELVDIDGRLGVRLTKVFV